MSSEDVCEKCGNPIDEGDMITAEELEMDDFGIPSEECVDDIKNDQEKADIAASDNKMLWD